MTNVARNINLQNLFINISFYISLHTFISTALAMLLFLNGLNCPIFTCSVCFGVELNLFIFTTTHQVTSDVSQNMDLGLFFKMMCVLKSISQREVIQILSIWIIPTFYYSFWAIILRSSPIIIISTIDPYFEVSFEKKCRPKMQLWPRLESWNAFTRDLKATFFSTADLEGGFRWLLLL